MVKCKYIKKDGSPCRAAAVKSDPDGLCVFHSPRQSGQARKAHVVTAQELIRTLGREIRILRKDKSLPPLARAAEIRNLVQMWKTLKGFDQPSADEGAGTLEKQLEKWKSVPPSSKP
jgi:hypothetical protein